MMTSPGKHAALFEALPKEVGELAGIVQGLLLHEHVSPSYGVELSDERRNKVHIRRLESMIDRLLEHDGRPLGEARSLDDRLIGNCRDFTLFTVASLRQHGVPARARCGFGAYFEPGRFVDHWVCEYWREGEGRWARADAQIDELQRDLFKPDFNLLDVPQDRFLIAGDAWALCREGKRDPSNFGILDMSGLWFIAGNVVRDAAALNNMEMLPWDVWGGMVAPGEDISEDKLAFLDRLATITREPDALLEDLRAVYEDERVRVPDTVFNAVRNQPEAV
jgi:Transglutaminase-like superfamily